MGTTQSALSHTVRRLEEKVGVRLTSVLISPATSRTDRRTVLLWLTGLMIASGGVVVAIGGFWSMSTATVMRLVPDGSVPRALALLNGGNPLATTIAAPLGPFMGSLIGWRGASSASFP